jgi:hypothetical protein
VSLVIQAIKVSQGWNGLFPEDKGDYQALSFFFMTGLEDKAICLYFRRGYYRIFSTTLIIVTPYKYH